MGEVTNFDDTVNRGCGATSSENCTFFEVDSGNLQAGHCALTICPASGNICSLRLDFNSFNIAGPSTSTVAVIDLLNGQPVNLNETDAVQAALGTRCLTDTFSVTNPGGTVSNAHISLHFI